MNRQPMRQGNVILIPLPNQQLKLKPLKHLTLAKGEITGHSHKIVNGEAELSEKDDILYLKVLSAHATLTHEEHQPIEIPEGQWMIRIQRQYEPKSWQQNWHLVQD